MAKTSVKQLRMGDFEIKGEDVLQFFLRYRDIRKNLNSKENEEETKAENSEELNSSNIQSSDAEIDILGFSDDQKSDSENTICRERCNTQKSNKASLVSDLTMYKCMYKGCGQSFKSPVLLGQHTHNHTVEELRKRFCEKPEERQPETSESQECSYAGKYGDAVGVGDYEESDSESDVFRESHNSQKLKKTEPEARELKDSSDDTSFGEAVRTVDNEEHGARSDVSEVDQKLKAVKASSSRKLSAYVCPYENCIKFFSRPDRLSQHVRTHTGERPYVCPSENCSKSYARQQHLKRHIEVRHNDETKETLKCEICGLMLSNIYCLKKHVYRKHTTEKHKCSECGQTFAKQHQLQKHTYVHTGIKPFQCDYPDCEMKCLTLSMLKRHKLTHQKSRYACPQDSCQQKFDTYKDLQHHFMADHPKVCDICSRPFRQLRSLKKHRLTHENTVKAYFCTYPACDKHYTQLNNLTAHIMQKHKHMKIYECGVCAKRLSSKQKLIHHLTTHSPNYKRNYVSKKPRKARKDKGCIRQDYARLLSGYTGPEEGENVLQILKSNIAEDSIDASTCPNISSNAHSELLTGTENKGSDSTLEAEEI